MFGMADYTVKGYAAPREMGEMEPPKRKPAENREYRGREMGEYNVPSRAEQQANYDKSNTTNPIFGRSNEYRPREMGETPAQAARQEQSPMTEQQRRLDLYA